jgi:hypothetical protein
MRPHAMLRLLQPLSVAAMLPSTAFHRSALMSSRAAMPVMQMGPMQNGYGGYNNNYAGGYNNNGYNSQYSGGMNNGYNSQYSGGMNNGYNSQYSGGMQGQGYNRYSSSSSSNDRPLGYRQDYGRGGGYGDYGDRYSSTERFRNDNNGRYGDRYGDRPRSRYSLDRYDDDRYGSYGRNYQVRSDYDDSRYLARNRATQGVYDRYSRRGRSYGRSYSDGDYYGPMSRRGYNDDYDSYDTYGMDRYGSNRYAPRSIAYSVMTGRDDYDDRFSLLPANEAESVMSRSLHGTAVKDAEWREARRRSRRDGYDGYMPPQREHYQMRLRPTGV